MDHRGWQRRIPGLFLSLLLIVTGACVRPAATGGMASPARSDPAPLRPSDAAIHEAFGRIPLHFEANRGQAEPGVKFLARGAGYGVFLAPNELVLSLREGALRMSLVGARPNPEIEGLDELPGTVNYLIGRDPTRWRTGVPTYARVKYDAVYPGVDLVLYGNQRQLEYDFILAPGADPGRIRLRFRGAERLDLDTDGNLVVSTGTARVLQHKPVIYQDVNGRREPVEGGYVVHGRDAVAFRIGPYDQARPLVIDPVLSYSTLLGGASTDRGEAIAVDSAGNAYVAGMTASADFPVANPLQPAKNASSDAFVVKLNPSGSALVYSTYLGGSDTDAALAIALDGSENAYITGYTFSTDFPTDSAYQGTPAAGAYGNAFVAKLTASGNALAYSTYLGGATSPGPDEQFILQVGTAIAVDAAGSAYVAGYTVSDSFPTTAGALRPSRADTGFEVGFVTKLASDGASLVYSTYLSGDPPSFAGADFSVALGIAVDGGGHAYVTGSAADDFTTTPAAYRENAPQTGSGFALKLNTSGSSLVYSTFLAHRGEAIAVDAEGHAHVAGSTCLACGSANDTTAGAFQPSPAGGNDAFVIKLNPGGSALVWGTHLGGSDAEEAFGVALDGAGAVHVVGWTGSTDFPTVDGLQPTPGPAGFITKFTASGGLVYSSTLGQQAATSALDVVGRGVAVDGAGDAYVTGWLDTSSGASFPTTPGAFQTTPAGQTEVVVAKMTGESTGGDTMPPTVSITSPSNGAWMGDGVKVTVTASDNVGLSSITVWGAGAAFATVPCSGTTCSGQVWFDTTGKPNGAYQLNAVATDTAGNETVSATVTVNKHATSPVFPSGVATGAGGGGGDTTGPTVAMTAPASGATVSGTVTASATASDDVAVASVQFKLDGANLGAADTTAPYSISWDTATASNSSHTLTAVATDASGNATTSAPTTVTVSNPPPGGGDPTAPTVAITSPSNGAWMGNGVKVTVTASDDVGLSSITVWGAGAAFATVSCSGTTCSGEVWFDTTGKPNGAYELNAIATDSAGNQKTSATVTVNKNATSPVYPSGVTAGSEPPTPGDPPPGDPTAPTVAITSPSNGAWMGNGVKVSVTASDDVGLAHIEVWGAGAVFATVPCSGTTCGGETWFDTTGKPNAAYELNAVATDAAGNETISATVTVNKNATSPVVPSGAGGG